MRRLLKIGKWLLALVIVVDRGRGRLRSINRRPS